MAQAISIGLTMILGGPLLTPLAGAGHIFLTSPRAGAAVAETFYGPKGMRTAETEEYEDRIERAIARRQEREDAE